MMKSIFFIVQGALKTGLIWSTFFLFCTQTIAQPQRLKDDPNTLNPASDYFKQGISPQVAMMNHYGEYPVDYSTGLVDITIPLYTIETPSLTLPLALKFHPSGLRADEREGLFGIRWVLSGLGHISRNIKGYPDDYSYSYPFNNDITNPEYKPTFNDVFGTTSSLYKDSGGRYNSVFTSSTYLDGNNMTVPGGRYQDTEYDVFSYNLPNGKSGKFIAPNGIGFTMPYEPMRIYSGTDTKTSTASVIDENGVTYRFGETRKTSDYPSGKRSKLFVSTLAHTGMAS